LLGEEGEGRERWEMGGKLEAKGGVRTTEPFPSFRRKNIVTFFYSLRS